MRRRWDEPVWLGRLVAVGWQEQAEREAFARRRDAALASVMRLETNGSIRDGRYVGEPLASQVARLRPVLAALIADSPDAHKAQFQRWREQRGQVIAR
ncbi:hypothetical protein M2317_002198 [Microbacterium sp. ZKA21]|uniref:hypothetical protein n=1 Tax=Microbacterium sp. ZKA21 TaxID=3381694 RepID=UPI003D1FF230